MQAEGPAEAKDEALFRRGMAVVAELVRLHPIPFAISVTGSAFFAGGTVASTIVLGRVTDRVILPAFETGEPPPGAIGWAVLAVLAVTVIRASGVVFRRYFAAMTAERSQMSLRGRLIDRYLGLPLAWHQRQPTGQLLAYADNDSEVTTEVIHPLPFSLGVAFLALFSAIALLVVDPLISAVALLIFPAMVVLNRTYSRMVEGPAARVQAGVGRVSSIAHESFDGALVVKTLGRADAENERFTHAARDLQEHRRRVGFIRSGFEALLDAIPQLGIAGVVMVGAYRIAAGAMTVGDLVQVASLFSLLVLPMRVFGFFLESMPPSVVARDRLQSVFREDVPPRPAGLPPEDSRPVLEAVGVGYRYPTARDGRELAGGGIAAAAGENAAVLNGIDLRIEPGEVVAIVGSTGSGKSTLCALLAGLLPPSSGTITVGGVEVGNLDPATRTSTIGLVFQEPFLFADSLRANIDLGVDSTEVGIDDARMAEALETAQVARFLPELPDGLDTVIGERGVTLSGGQRQRVALARALLLDPRILILDDATSAVDPVVEREILDRLGRSSDAATLIVAQRVSTIELADRVLFLRAGRIAAEGTHRQLLADPAYAAIVRAYEEASLS